MSTIETRHGPLAFAESGHGPPLLLLHANGHDSRDFDAVRPELARRFRTIALDWPGMGASPPLARPDQATVTMVAEALEDVVAALDLGPAVVVGHSVGGFAAARLAVVQPHRVRALVLVDSGGFVALRWTDRLFCRVKGVTVVTRAAEGHFARFHTKGRNAHAAAMFARIDAARRRPGYAETVAALWRSFATPAADLRPVASRIECRTLLVWGARDPVLPFSRAGRGAERAIRGARGVTLATGHTPFVEDPAGFLAATLPFIESLSTPREELRT